MAKTWTAAPSKSTKRVPAKTVRKAAVVVVIAAVAVGAIAAAAEAAAAVVVVIAAAVAEATGIAETAAATKPATRLKSRRASCEGRPFRFSIL
jgi:hypothetical protein